MTDESPSHARLPLTLGQRLGAGPYRDNVFRPAAFLSYPTEVLAASLRCGSYGLILASYASFRFTQGINFSGQGLFSTVNRLTLVALRTYPPDTECATCLPMPGSRCDPVNVKTAPHLLLRSCFYVWSETPGLQLSVIRSTSVSINFAWLVGWLRDFRRFVHNGLNCVFSVLSILIGTVVNQILSYPQTDHSEVKLTCCISSSISMVHIFQLRAHV